MRMRKAYVSSRVTFDSVTVYVINFFFWGNCSNLLQSRHKHTEGWTCNNKT